VDERIGAVNDPATTQQAGDVMKVRQLGLAAIIVAAAIPIFIVLFGVAAGSGMPSTAQSDPRLAATFFREHAALMGGLFLNSIVMHLAVIALAIGLYPRLAATSPYAAAFGAVLGVAWGILDIAQSSIGYATTVGTATVDAVTVDAIAKAIQNAAHLGGGLWVLSIALAGATAFGRAHRAFAALAGTVFALHVLVVPLQPAWWALEYIGLPVFFGWTGLALLRSTNRSWSLAPAGGTAT
jgi:hypothetical protein